MKLVQEFKLTEADVTEAVQQWLEHRLLAVPIKIDGRYVVVNKDGGEWMVDTARKVLTYRVEVEHK